jgi:hypothetical protein
MALRACVEATRPLCCRLLIVVCGCCCCAECVTLAAVHVFETSAQGVNESLAALHERLRADTTSYAATVWLHFGVAAGSSCYAVERVVRVALPSLLPLVLPTAAAKVIGSRCLLCQWWCLSARPASVSLCRSVSVSLRLCTRVYMSRHLRVFFRASRLRLPVWLPLSRPVPLSLSLSLSPHRGSHCTLSYAQAYNNASFWVPDERYGVRIPCLHRG